MRCQASANCRCNSEYHRMWRIILSIGSLWERGEITRKGALELAKDTCFHQYCILACTAAHFPDLEIRALAKLEMSHPLYERLGVTAETH